MLSLVTVSPVITAFHSCCLSHHVFDQVKPLTGLGRIWNRYLLTMLTWNRRDSTLRHGPRRVIKDGFFGLINPYLVFHSRVRTEFLYLSFNWNHFEMRLLNLRINFYLLILRLRSLISKWFQLKTSIKWCSLKETSRFWLDFLNFYFKRINFIIGFLMCK